MQQLFAQLVRFGVVGILATLIDFGLMIFLTEMVQVNYLISATASFSLAIVFNYLASMRFVFTRRDKTNRVREFTLFVVLSVVGLLINGFCMKLGVSSLAIDYRITKIAATIIVTLWNFVTRKVFFDADSQDRVKSAD
jgi:putative flippase GtrA